MSAASSAGNGGARHAGSYYIQPAPPCELGCGHVQNCRTNKLSCKAFDVYVATGLCHEREQGDIPTSQKFDAQFNADPAGDLRSAEARQAARLRAHTEEADR